MAGRKLTSKAVDAAKPGASRREIPDGLVAGLYLVVQPSGAKGWAVRYRAATGKPRKATLGRYPQMDLSAARTAAKEAFQAVERGDDPAAAKKAERQARADTFANVAEDFVEKHCKRHNRSWKEQQSILQRHATPVWGDRPVAGLAKRDVIELVESIHDHGAPYSANRTLATVRKLFAWAVERDIVASNPAEHVKAPGHEATRDRVLSDDELAALWGAFAAMGSRAGAVMQLLALTAQRRGEVAAMRWDALDLEAGAWTVAQTKNGKPHVVPLSAPALAIIEAQPRIADSPFVFPCRTDKNKPMNGWGRPKDQAARLAGVEEWRLHDLRRTAASGMARLGVAPHVIEAVLNHTSGTWAGVAGVYQRYRFDTEKRHALEAWTAHVMSITGNAPEADNVVALGAADA